MFEWHHCNWYNIVTTSNHWLQQQYSHVFRFTSALDSWIHKKMWLKNPSENGFSPGLDASILQPLVKSWFVMFNQFVGPWIGWRPQHHPTWKVVNAKIWSLRLEDSPSSHPKLWWKIPWPYGLDAHVRQKVSSSHVHGPKPCLNILKPLLLWVKSAWNHMKPAFWCLEASMFRGRRPKGCRSLAPRGWSLSHRWGGDLNGGFKQHQRWLKSGWWFGTWLYFSIYWEESSQLTIHIFQRGWNHQPEMVV